MRRTIYFRTILPAILSIATVAQAVTMQVPASLVAVEDDGKCSLVEAIYNANNDDQSSTTDCPAGNGADTIELASNSIYSLSVANGLSGLGATALPLIYSSVTILGHGSTIGRAAAAPRMRIAAVEGGAPFPDASLTLDHVTVSDGFTEDGKDGSPPTAGSPGGALTVAAAELNLIDCTIRGNQTGRGGNNTGSGSGAAGGDGGAIYVFSGTLNVIQTTISDNLTGPSGDASSPSIPTFGAKGGAISASYGQIAISGSHIHGNASTGAGGGIYESSGLGFSLVDSTVALNSTTRAEGNSSDGWGGGIAFQSETMANIKNSQILSNHTSDAVAANSFPGAGGGLAMLYSTVVIDGSTISGNTTGSGIGGGSGGGIVNFAGDLTLENCTVSNNQTGIGVTYGGAGGGIDSYNGGSLTLSRTLLRHNKTGDGTSGGGSAGGLYVQGAFTMRQSSVVGNTTGNGSPTTGTSGFGGGLVLNQGPVTISDSTISGNSTGTLSAARGQTGGLWMQSIPQVTIHGATINGNDGATGGGIFVSGATLAIANTIIANSTDGADCFKDGAGVILGLADHNLVADGSCGFSAAGDPRLAPLNSNGGPTPSHALCTGVGVPDLNCPGASPAINAGSDAVCTVTNLDQRGFLRAGAGSHCDIGAFEAASGGVIVGAGVGLPGGIACVPVSLSTGNAPLTTNNSMDFDAATFTFDAAVIHPNIGAGSAPDKQLTVSSGGSGVESFVISGSNMVGIPNGPLYTARFLIDPNAAPGSFPLLGTTDGLLTITACTGDCNGNGAVSIGEVTRCVNNFLGVPLCSVTNPSSNCPVSDTNANGSVSIGEVTQCVNSFLAGC